jgi:hypothetical protein
MKGLSVIVALALLVLAQRLARHLNAAGALPLDGRPQPGNTLFPADKGPSPELSLQL